MKNKNYTKCPICKTKVEIDNYLETYISPYNNQEYKLYECPNCELQWWEPLKIDPKFYESEFNEAYIAFHEGIRTRIGENHKAFFKYFPQNVKGRLLDIGCGDGVFLREAKKYGFEVWGIDFDRKSVEVAKRSLGVETIYSMSLEEFYDYAKKRNLKFDVITFFEVLEHQDKPRKFLEIVKDLLREGGYIAGSVPNRESIFQKELYQKIYSIIDYPPNHFLRFSQKTLNNTLQTVGFREIKVIKLDFPKYELPTYIEKKLFGRKLDNLKIFLKGKVIGNKRLSYTIAVDDLPKLKPTPSSYFLKVLKQIRNIMLFPLSLPYFLKLKENGLNLYFQGRKIN